MKSTWWSSIKRAMVGQHRADLSGVNIALIKAIVTKYPEFREAFAAILRALWSLQGDYGSLMAMKEIKVGF